MWYHPNWLCDFLCNLHSLQSSPASNWFTIALAFPCEELEKVLLLDGHFRGSIASREEREGGPYFHFCGTTWEWTKRQYIFVQFHVDMKRAYRCILSLKNNICGRKMASEAIYDVSHVINFARLSRFFVCARGEPGITRA